MSYQKILTSLGFEKQRLAIGDRHGDFWVRTASWSDHPLRLELVCGASDVDPEHDAYWGGETLTHPKHDYIEQLAEEQGMKMFRPGTEVIGAFEEWGNPDHYRTGVVVKQPKIEKGRTDTNERILVAVHWNDTPEGEYEWKSSVLLNTPDEVIKSQQKELKFSGEKPKKMLVDKPKTYAEVRSDPRQVSLYGPEHERELQDMYAKPSMKSVKSTLLKGFVGE